MPTAFPRYRYPTRVIVGLARDALLGRHRLFSEDARACIAHLHPPVRILGADHIPQHGPCVLTPNHYYRPGFASQWSALAISAFVPASVSASVHWVMTRELTFPGKWFAPFGMPISRLLLDRIARVYGFTTMPPMPPRPRDVAARAASVLRLLRFARHAEAPIIALAPEGGDQPAGILSMPPPGLGRFCLLLAAAGLRFVPVGVYECDGELTLNFNPAYDLDIPPHLPVVDQDRLAAYTIMTHIAALLPLSLRGNFEIT